MRAVKKENQDQHQRSDAQQTKNHCGMLEPFVINSHTDHHGDETADGPTYLAQQEEISRVIPLFCYYRRSAEHHHQPDKNQQQSDDEQQAVHAYAFCHSSFISSRGRQGTENSLGQNSSEGLLLWFPRWRTRIRGNCKVAHQLFERSSAVFIILELVEAGASGRE